MFLSKVERNSVIFIDANIFLYNISMHQVHGDNCKAFLNRIEKGELSGKTNVIVLNELLHKLILGEVSLKYNITLSQSAGYIKKNPDILSSLDAYDIIDDTGNIPNLEVIGISPDIFNSAKEYMKKFKLMTNDAIHVATCKFYNIVDIATNDTDFQRVHFLISWNP
jgi:predicted nucleic acid-binding protein